MIAKSGGYVIIILEREKKQNEISWSKINICTHKYVSFHSFVFNLE
jgi:hypothetical protein